MPKDGHTSIHAITVFSSSTIMALIFRLKITDNMAVSDFCWVGLNKSTIHPYTSAIVINYQSEVAKNSGPPTRDHPL
jgi:hypothetical protein